MSTHQTAGISILVRTPVFCQPTYVSLYEMDFLDPKKKRAHNIRLIIGYCLVATALILASVLLLFAAFGYGINSSTGEVTQNGLVFVDAHPEQASITLNGQDRGKTDGRFVLEAGTYSLQLKRDGYRSWQRNFVLEGGNIVRMVYPFLFPDKLNNKDALAYAQVPDMVSVSPDRHWIVSHAANAPTTFQVTDTSTIAAPTAAINIPAAVLGTHTGTPSLEAVEWSTDNRHLLLKYTFDGGFDYIVLDRDNPETTVSVTQTLGKSFSSVTLRDKKADQLYVIDTASNQLQAASLKDKTIVAVADNVISYWPYKNDTILYATNQGATAGKTLVKLKDNQDTYTIREVMTGAKYLLNMAEFDSNTYVIAGSSADGKVYIYKNPLTTLKKQNAAAPLPLILLKVDNPEYLSFSGNARFISVQGGSTFAIYDAETKNQYKYDTKLPLLAGQKATWMDGHRLMLTSAGKMTVFDYDGENKQTLVSQNASFIPMFDRDYNVLFTVGPTTGDAAKTGLVRTQLNLGQDF